MKTTSLSLVLVLFVSVCALKADSSATDTALAKMATQVVAKQQTMRLGDPIIVSLSVSNQTQQVKEMEGHPTVFGGFEITDPDGQTVPYVGGGGQITATMIAVQPGSTVTNAGTLDLTSKYLFQKAGRYLIRFSGGIGLSNSPAIAIEVTAGRLSEMDEIAVSLLPLCPNGWHLAKVGRVKFAPFGSCDYLQLRHNAMHQETVDLYFTKEEAKVDPNQQPRLKIQYLGRARGQFVYGSVGTNAPALWPTAIEDISSALQIKKR